LKPLVWLGSSKADLMALPPSVIDTFGYGLYLAQSGGKHPQAKVLRGFGSAGVLEIVEDWRGNTYRAVYTVEVGETVYVLHVFQKKAKRGTSTPRPDLDLIDNRLKAARKAAGET
jgi:phage-related protein